MSERQVIRRRLWRRVFPVLGDWALRLLYGSCRWTFIDRQSVVHLMTAGRPFIGVTWHYSLMPVIYLFRHTRAAVMVSRSRDGEPVAKMVQRWGYLTARGSKYKGGLDAAKELIRLAKDGHIIGLVADGSQGPPLIAQTGAVFIARAAQIPLVPIIAAARHKLVLPTWDRFEVPCPFSRLAVYFGQPMTVPSKSQGSSLEEARFRIERALNELRIRADHHKW